MPISAPNIFSHNRYWAECYGNAPFLPMSRAEMDELGWDSCDIIIVCGDAYVDHPSFGMAVIGRFLEAQGFRVGIIAQPNWQSTEDFMALGKPNLFWGVSAGNMDSMINRYTADLRMRSDDAYTPDGAGGKRPDRAVIVYSQRCREASPETPIVIGGIEASLRRIAQYDYWSDKVRQSVLVDSGADILLYGNAERAIADVAHEIARGKHVNELSSIRGTAIVRRGIPEGWTEIDSTRIDWPGQIDKLTSPYEYIQKTPDSDNQEGVPVRIVPMPLQAKEKLNPQTTYIRLPSFEKVRADSALYAHASRILHQESNPHNAHVLVQRHGNREVWVNPPPIPLQTDEMDGVFDLSYQRVPHPSYGEANIPAYEMIRFSVNIMRGCFGGCTFCSITEHEGRVIQSRSQESILREIENIRDKTPGFTGTISDLGGPTANMYQLNCKDDKIQASCRRLSCVHPTICKNLITDHSPTTQLYRKARAIPGVKRVAIASGLRYDLAVEDPEYVRELVTHHVGGYLKIAPEHSEDRPLSKMMKPGMGSYHKFEKMFNQFSKEAGKKQYLIPYFIASHPGCEDEDMVELALWLKKRKMRVDQVQNFYPSPMALATAMYHSERNPLKRLSYKDDKIPVPRGIDQRRLQKALLRYHDEKNWPVLRKALRDMNRAELIGDGDNQLIPAATPTMERNPRQQTRKSKQRARRSSR
ncbi:MAG TPA: YgiQ family radical SAM protein [Chromatiaceae bacterium]|jgi:uncharacterized radical SAM protein YgiQ|nr:YgiQ family radical SAM protein [Chromatiaceae bacterium]HIB84912.1 YgiQ family radical SAM protein [Chromatiaceae bacterium]HIN82728.1 YgiQ family radical SAM protein [Chromatiales bacterium]HIO14941.1 YgiQ family radical SAM protein [Chromatiales bacterium]